MRRWVQWIAAFAVACSAPPARPVENRSPSAVREPPRSACPRMVIIDGDPWQSIAFPQCPSEPFETDLPVCAGRACPRPCRVTMTYPDIAPRTLEIHYDDAGRWLESTPIAAGSNSNELHRVATYDGDRMQSCHSSNPNVDYTEILLYEGGRLVRTTHGQDGNLRLAYDGDRVVRIDHGTRATTIAYDRSNRVVAVTADRTTSYHYDDTGLLVGLDEDYEHSRYSYDAQRRLVRIDSTYSGGDAVSGVVTIRYDDRARVVAIVNDTTVDRAYRYATLYEYCD